MKADELGVASGASGSLEGEPKTRRAALAFILITMVLEMLALGTIMPLLPKLSNKRTRRWF